MTADGSPRKDTGRQDLLLQVSTQYRLQRWRILVDSSMTVASLREIIARETGWDERPWSFGVAHYPEANFGTQEGSKDPDRQLAGLGLHVGGEALGIVGCLEEAEDLLRLALEHPLLPYGEVPDAVWQLSMVLGKAGRREESMALLDWGHDWMERRDFKPDFNWEGDRRCPCGSGRCYQECCRDRVGIRHPTN